MPLPLPLPLPSLETLNRRLRLDRETGKLYWRPITLEDCSAQTLANFNSRYANKEAGRITNYGYRTLKIRRQPYYVHRLIWKMVHGTDPDPLLEIDHINRVKSDNRPENLRLVNRRQNKLNSDLYKNNSSGCRGVQKSGNKFVAKVKDHGRQIYLGTFKTAIEAHQAYENFRSQQLQTVENFV